MVNSPKADSLVLENDRLARAIAHKVWLKVTHLPKEDLEQAGRIGLIKASRRFDPQQKTQFTTFAYTYINGEIQREIRDKWQPLKIRRKYYELKNKFQKLQSTGLSDLEIATTLEITLQELEELKQSISYSMVSLEDRQIQSSQENEDMGVFIPEFTGRTKDVFQLVCYWQRTTSNAIALALGVTSGTVRKYLIKLNRYGLITKNGYWYSPNLEQVAIDGIRNQIMDKKNTINSFIDNLKTLLDAKNKVATLKKELSETEAAIAKLELDLARDADNSESVKWLIQQIEDSK